MITLAKHKNTLVRSTKKKDHAGNVDNRFLLEITTSQVNISKFHFLFFSHFGPYLEAKFSERSCTSQNEHLCGIFSLDSEVKNVHFVVGYFVDGCLC
jgi:hypothetical protein